VECSIDAAQHIFGYGVADKTQHMIRLGWAANSGGLEEAYKRLDKFEFLQGRMMVQEPIRDDEPEEPPVTKPETEDEETDPESRGVVSPPANNLLAKMASMAG
jgi:hypothetical protein